MSEESEDYLSTNTLIKLTEEDGSIAGSYVKAMDEYFLNIARTNRVQGAKAIVSKLLEPLTQSYSVDKAELRRVYDWQVNPDGLTLIIFASDSNQDMIIKVNEDDYTSISDTITTGQALALHNGSQLTLSQKVEMYLVEWS
jgi:hypothetical protein